MKQFRVELLKLSWVEKLREKEIQDCDWSVGFKRQTSRRRYWNLCSWCCSFTKETYINVDQNNFFVCLSIFYFLYRKCLSFANSLCTPLVCCWAVSCWFYRPKPQTHTVFHALYDVQNPDFDKERFTPNVSKFHTRLSRAAPLKKSRSDCRTCLSCKHIFFPERFQIISWNITHKIVVGIKLNLSSFPSGIYLTTSWPGYQVGCFLSAGIWQFCE